MTEHLVVLDGYTLNPGDINWNSLQALGDLDIHDRTTEDLILERAKGATCILTNKTPRDQGDHQCPARFKIYRCPGHWLQRGGYRSGG